MCLLHVVLKRVFTSIRPLTNVTGKLFLHWVMELHMPLEVAEVVEATQTYPTSVVCTPGVIHRHQLALHHFCKAKYSVLGSVYSEWHNAPWTRKGHAHSLPSSHQSASRSVNNSLILTRKRQCLCLSLLELLLLDLSFSYRPVWSVIGIAQIIEKPNT